jgi:hypothetical protein
MGATPALRRPAVDRLARYGFSMEEIDLLATTLDSFRCRDTCGRDRRCLKELDKAAERGDMLADKLRHAPSGDRLLDEAALAYGRRLGRIYC